MDSSHETSLDEIEDLFLVGRFSEALALCIQQMRNTFGFDFYTQQYVTSENEAPHLNGKELSQYVNRDTTKLNLQSSVPLVSLLVQILYELKRSDEIMNLILRFYGSLENIPFDILFICINLYVTLGQHAEAKKLIFHVLQHYTPVDTEQQNVGPLSIQQPQISREQYNQVIEIYLFHILEPTAGLDSVLKVLNGSAEEAHSLPLSSMDKSLFEKRVREAQEKRFQQLHEMQQQNSAVPPFSPHPSPISHIPSNSIEASRQSSSESPSRKFQHRNLLAPLITFLSWLRGIDVAVPSTSSNSITPLQRLAPTWSWQSSIVTIKRLVHSHRQIMTFCFLSFIVFFILLPRRHQLSQYLQTLIQRCLRYFYEVWQMFTTLNGSVASSPTQTSSVNSTSPHSLNAVTTRRLPLSSRPAASFYE
jgi:hypothetical protein